MVASRLRAQEETISRIRTAFGTPSISCGVLHHGDIVFLHSEGFANVEKNLVASSETVYSIASCSKGFVTALCHILVREGKLSWTRPIREYLPDFNTPHDPEIARRATLLDLCSHGTGLAPLDHAGCGFYDEFYNKGEDQVHIASHLPVAYDFRSRWLYNNFMLGVVGDVISAVCGKSAGTVLKEKIFDPLGLYRTCTNAAGYPSDANVATGYSVLDDGSLLPSADPKLEDGSVQGASGFIRSTVSDMLSWARSIMLAEGDSKPLRQHRQDEDRSCVLDGIEFTRCARRPITYDCGVNENSYGLGWFRHQLPSKWLGSIGPNFALLPDPPVIARTGGSRLTICHYGEFGGFLSSFYTFPDTCSAVIVLANSSPSRGDPTDLIAQTFIQELFDMQPKVMLEEYAVHAAQTSKLIWPALVEEWVSSRVQNTMMPPLDQFTGNYSNPGLMMDIHIFELQNDQRGTGPNPEVLGFSINSMKKQRGKLRHYHYDVWTFLPHSRDDLVRKGMEGYMLLPMLLFSFVRHSDGRVYAMDWDLQAGACEGPAPGLDRAVAPVRFVRQAEKKQT
ncbi:beta-lactamase/transpeptidase-like protein [Lophiotrema nucula]|uniref:Beta-lactamase/transpeptidase-like protein n=1 Tax=Lophiotrema nucula TaxID=690887 RepID=A0A6A5YFK2_9PLEO|nr:beta-lactamase/transpeptidase-like protein [Lophiotrema nucula]